MANELLSLTADIVSAHPSHNKVDTGEVAGLISSVYKALGATSSAEPEQPKQESAVSIRASVKPDHLISFESEKKMKMLKRYLMTNYGMSPDDYRRKWGLPKDYPMVAPNYAERRRALAVKIGLGRGGTRKKAASPVKPKAAKNGSKGTLRKSKAQPAQQ